MKNIGFLGGSFDPIHFGHLNLAIEIFEKLKLDKILFCPTNISPFKTDKLPIANSEDRFEMVKLVIKDIENFEITDIEIKKPGISYTDQTLQELKNGDNLKLIVTDDVLLSFHLWKDYKKILKIAPLIVGSRFEDLTEYKNEYFTLSSKNFVKTNLFDISSTNIRKRLKTSKYVGHLVPKEVLDYIYKRELYL